MATVETSSSRLGRLRNGTARGADDEQSQGLCGEGWVSGFCPHVPPGM